MSATFSPKLSQTLVRLVYRGEREVGGRGICAASALRHRRRPPTIRLATTGHLVESRAEGGEATVTFPSIRLMYRGEREEREREREKERERRERK